MSETIDLHSDLARQMCAWIEDRVSAPDEILVEGPAGTGKTHTILQWLLRYAEIYPRSKIVFLRNERSAMSETLLAEWEEAVFGPLYPELVRGQQRRDREKYGPLPNGSQFLLRGFDNEQKLFSGQCHIAYFNEATELRSEEKWETLHRMKRAPNDGGQPFRALIADCNPRQKHHWLNMRATDGPEGQPARMRRVRTHLYDNPRWFDHDSWRWTADGAEYIGSMARGFTGVNRSRLLLGQWENASGSVLPQWSDADHWVNATQERAGDALLVRVKGWPDPVEIRWCFASMDCGHENAAVFGVWGVDIKGRMFELCEIYRTHWTHDEWAQAIVVLAREFRLQGIAADHDKALIAAINRALINAGMPPITRIADKTLGMSGDKGKTARIEMMRSRLQRGELFYLRNVNRYVDDELVALGRPYMTPMELPRLQHEEFVYGEDDVATAEKVDKRFPDHGFDMTLYGIAFAAGKALATQQAGPRYAPGTAGSILNHPKYAPRPKPTRAAFKSWRSA